MINLVPCRTRFIFQCHGCEATAEYEVDQELHRTLRQPQLPGGWRLIERRLYCPKHDVSIIVTERGGEAPA